MAFSVLLYILIRTWTGQRFLGKVFQPLMVSITKSQNAKNEGKVDDNVTRETIMYQAYRQQNEQNNKSVINQSNQSDEKEKGEQQEMIAKI